MPRDTHITVDPNTGNRFPEGGKCYKEWFADTLQCEYQDCGAISRAWCLTRARVKYAMCRMNEEDPPGKLPKSPNDDFPNDPGWWMT